MKPIPRERICYFPKEISNSTGSQIEQPFRSVREVPKPREGQRGEGKPSKLWGKLRWFFPFHKGITGVRKRLPPSQARQHQSLPEKMVGEEGQGPDPHNHLQ